MDLTSVTANALSAARSAAGTTWGQIQHNFERDFEGVIESAAEIEELLRTRQISEQDAADALEVQRRTLSILGQEAEVEAKVVIQNAINAALDVVWTAVKTAAKLPL